MCPDAQHPSQVGIDKTMETDKLMELTSKAKLPWYFENIGEYTIQHDWILIA